MFTALGFFLFLKALDPETTISLDTDWFYRKAARLFMWFAEKPVVSWESMVSTLSDTVIWRSLNAAARGSLKSDQNIVDAIVNGVARTALACGASVRRMQTGVVTHYAGAMIGGVLASIALYVLLRSG
jgi:multicomponent Na+:H+ antiporter subunit D